MSTGRPFLGGADKQVFDHICTTDIWRDWLSKESYLNSSVVDLSQDLVQKLRASREDGPEVLAGEELPLLGALFKTLCPSYHGELLRAPLVQAAGEGNEPLAQALINAGAPFGTALHEAVRNDRARMVVFLLNRGAFIHRKDTAGDTALHVCAKLGKPGIARSLLHLGADRNGLGDERGTPIYWAAREGHLSMAELLLDAGCNMTVRRLGAVSPLDTAAAKGHTDIMKLFIERGADVNGTDPDGRPALHFAAFWDEVGAVNMLVAAGANVRARDGWGSTALCHAACRHNVKLVLALLRAGAEINVLDQNKRTPLHFASANAGRPGGADVVDVLLRWGADETLADDGGKRPLDVVGEQTRGQDRLADDVARAKRLLRNARGDRAWRRRGYMVMCRAHPQRVRLQGHPPEGMAARTRSRAAMALADDGDGLEGRGAAKRMKRDWAAVAARVLGHEIEGIFRTIVGFL